MIKPATTKTLKIVDKNITAFQSSALNYVFVPVSSQAKVDPDFNKEVNKKWTNLDHQLKLWKAAVRTFTPGSTKLHSVQSNAVIIFAYCLNDDGSLNEEWFRLCLKEISNHIKYNDGCVDFSKKIKMVDNLEEFIKLNFVDKNISCYLFN